MRIRSTQIYQMRSGQSMCTPASFSKVISYFILFSEQMKCVNKIRRYKAVGQKYPMALGQCTVGTVHRYAKYTYCTSSIREYECEIFFYKNLVNHIYQMVFFWGKNTILFYMVLVKGVVNDNISILLFLEQKLSPRVKREYRFCFQMAIFWKWAKHVQMGSY